MLNKEKYQKKLEDILSKTIAVYQDYEEAIEHCGTRPCKKCIFFKNNKCGSFEAAREWLNSECKEPVLTDEEREYLSAVIKPFRKKVEYIAIWGDWNGSKQFVHIELYDDDYMNFPNFEKNTMYKGMEPRKHYSLEELGL